MNKKKAPSRNPSAWMYSTPRKKESDAWVGTGGRRPFEPGTTVNEKPDSEALALNQATPASHSWEPPRSSAQRVPKFETFRVKLTARLNDQQLEFLSGLERQIMRSRSAHNRSERITKNSIIRAAINALMEAELDTHEIGSELELEHRVLSALRNAPTTNRNFTREE